MTTGIIGAGNIGSAVARHLTAGGKRVVLAAGDEGTRRRSRARSAPGRAQGIKAVSAEFEAGRRGRVTQGGQVLPASSQQAGNAGRGTRWPASARHSGSYERNGRVRFH